MIEDGLPLSEDGTMHTVDVTRSDRWMAALKRQEFTLFLVIIAFSLVITWVNPVFISIGNITDLLTSTVNYFVAACGLTLIIIAGGFDFSVGSSFTLGGVGAAWLISIGTPWPFGVVGGLLMGALVGALNAAVIDFLEVPPIIATLGTFYLFAGGVVLFTGGQDIQIFGGSFVSLGRSAAFGVPTVVICGVVIGVLYHIVLTHTRFGYNVKAIGGNRLASLANGISVRRTNAWLYVGGGSIAAFAGVLYSANTGSGSVAAGGATMTLTAVSAVLIGGTSLFGGAGTIVGTALGAFLFAVINNGLAIASMPPLYTNIIVGTILIAAVALDSFRRRRALARAKRGHVGSVFRFLVKA